MDISEAIGRLEEQGRWVQKELTELKQDVHTLLAWRWKLYGMTAAVAVVSASVFQIFLALVKH